jgi:hypothetical protein
LYLYFTTLKSHFSILTTHFYKTTPIPFSILQYITLKYYKIILFYIYFFYTPTKPTAADQQQPPINPTPTPANPNPQPPYPRRQTHTHHNPFCLQPRREGREKSDPETPSPPANPNTNPITAGKPKQNPHHRREPPSPTDPETTHHQKPPTQNHLHRAVDNPQPPPLSR